MDQRPLPILLVKNVSNLTDARFASGIGADVVVFKHGVPVADITAAQGWLYNTVCALELPSAEDYTIEAANLDYFLCQENLPIEQHNRYAFIAKGESAPAGLGLYLLSRELINADAFSHLHPVLLPAAQGQTPQPGGDGYWIDLPDEPEEEFYEWAIEFAESIGK